MKVSHAIVALATLAGGLGVFEALSDNRIDLRVLSLSRTGLPAYASMPRSLEYLERSTIYRTTFEDIQTTTIRTYHDQFGMRSRGIRSEFAHPRSIALIGDSFTWGAEAAIDDALQGRLERVLGEVNILNFGIAGSNSNHFPDVTSMLLSETGKKLDAAVIGIYTDMLMGDLPRIAAEAKYGPGMNFEGAWVSRQRYDVLMSSAYEKWRFRFHMAARRWSALYNTLVRPKLSEDFAIPLNVAWNEQRVRALSRKLLDNIRRTAACANLSSSQVVIWFAPSVHDLTAIAHAQQPGASFPQWLHRSNEVWSEVSATLRSDGYNVVDARDAIQDIFLKGASYPYTVSGHLRPVGYEIVLTALEPVVRDALNFPRKLLDHARRKPERLGATSCTR